MIDRVRKSECVGCKACGDACPKNAISFPSDQEGFWYPNIDPQKCVNCGLCDRVCPVLNTYVKKEEIRKEPKTYKVYHKDKRVRYNSTSGALYYALAETFISEKSYIAGCVYNHNFTGAYHQLSNTGEGLNRIIGSKYFQSDMKGIFCKINALLKKGEKVLFCGTGCQVASLYTFLGKENENLYTIELICRGINSPLAFKAYMKELKEKYRAELKSVHFKNKSRGWLNLGTLVTFENGRVYYRDRNSDPWVNAFIVGNLYIRPCCENCSYKNFPRVADITIGDFWGLEFSDEEKKLGVSLALVNTLKGDEMLLKAKKNLKIEQRSLEEAVKGNPALLYPVKLNPKRTEFFERIKKEKYSKVVWDLLDKPLPKRMFNTFILKIKNWLRPICHWRRGS